VDAKNILTLKGEAAPFPFVYLGLGAFGLVLVVLLALVLVFATVFNIYFYVHFRALRGGDEICHFEQPAGDVRS
jgi:uncharacterized membrane protein